MKRFRKAICILVILTPFFYIVFKITFLNPVWVIATRYPEADVQLHSINSPDLHFWSSVASIFGVSMSDPDHSIVVQVSDYPEPISLDDFTGADEIYITRTEVVDISAFWKSRVQVSGAVFFDCDLSKIPSSQRKWLKPYMVSIPNSFCVSYDSKMDSNLAQ